MSSSLALLWRVMKHEARVLSADRSLWIVGTLLALLAGYALFNGLSDTREREALLASIHKQQADRVPAMRAQLQRVLSGAEKPDPFANPADPASIGSGGGGRHATMPYLALAPIAFGQSDMLPNYYRMTYRSKASFMDEGELENPWNLLSGRFDLAFVIVVLMPLAILALCYNLLSGEREQGTLRLLLAQPISVRTLVAGKVILRGAFVVGVLIAISLLVLLPLRGASVGAVIGLVSLTVAYAGFWCALAVAVNALNRSSAFNALVLMATWVAIVLVLPVLTNIAVGAASPAPSRTEFATKTRLVTIDGLNRYEKLLSADYRYVAEPETLKPTADGRFQVAPRRLAHYYLARDVDRELDEMRDAFDRQLHGQQTLVDRWSFLSPAVVAFESMSTLAGTNAARYLSFREQVDAFHAQWKAFFDPRVTGGRAMTDADFVALPAFDWKELDASTTRRQSLWHVAALVIPAILLSLFAFVRLRKLRVV